MKCFILSLVCIQLIILINTVLLSAAITLPDFSVENTLGMLAYAFPLAQIFAFLPSALFIAILSIAQINNWQHHAPLFGTVLGAAFYVFIGIFPVLQKSWNDFPINFIWALGFNAVIGGFYGLSIGLTLRWISLFPLCKEG